MQRNADNLGPNRYNGSMPKVRVLFVCLGNICRSPMAEAVFAHKVKEAGLRDIIDVDSAGTGSWHTGEPPHSGTIALLEEKEIAHSHRARTLTKSDLNEFDYILTMDEDNYRTVRYFGRASAKIARLIEFAPELNVREVPDPWFDGRFAHVYDLIEKASDGLLQAIRAEHNI
jgi:protein-tyrosine phosphatase